MPRRIVDPKVKKARRRASLKKKLEKLRRHIDSIKELLRSSNVAHLSVPVTQEHFRYGEVVVADSKQSEWVFVVISGSLAVMKRLQHDATPKKRKAPYRDASIHSYKMLVEYPRRSDASLQHAAYKNRIDMLTKLEEHIPGVYNMKERMESLDYDAIIAPHLERMQQRRSTTVTNEHRPVIAEEVSNGGHATTIIDALREKIDHASTKGLYLSLSREVSDVDNRNANAHNAKLPPVTEDDRVKLKKARRKQKNRHLAKTKKQGPVTTFLKMQTLEKGEQFGVSDMMFPDQPSVSLVSNGAVCYRLPKALLDKVDRKEWHKFVENELPYPTERNLRRELTRWSQWQTAKSSIYRRLVKQTDHHEHSQLHSDRWRA